MSVLLCTSITYTMQISLKVALSGVMSRPVSRGNSYWELFMPWMITLQKGKIKEILWKDLGPLILSFPFSSFNKTVTQAGSLHVEA